LWIRGEDIKDHISNNVYVTEIKWDPLGDNLPISNDDFFKFMNDDEMLNITYLFRKNTLFDNAVKNVNIAINSTKNNK
jgi:hypothetical protein